jgi:hypothetical protein
VLRFKFRTKIRPSNDVRKPRSSSFIESPAKAALPADAGAASGEAPRRKRSNTFVCADAPSPSQRPLPGAAPAGRGPTERAAVPAPADAVQRCQHGCDATRCTLGSCASMPRRGSGAAAAWAAAASPPPSETDAPSLAVAPRAAVPATPSAVPTSTRCKHGGEPAVCTYGSCIEARSTTASSSPVLKCKHGSTPGACPHGSCSRPVVIGTKKCKHGNPPTSCKYGSCPLMEKMVQEEIARMKASAPASAEAPARSAAIAADGGPAVPAAHAEPRPAAADALEHSPVRVRGGGPQDVPATPTAVRSPSLTGLTLTGGKRLIKKTKKRPQSASKPVRKLVKRPTTDTTPPSSKPAATATRSKGRSTNPASARVEAPAVDPAPTDDSPKSRRMLFTGGSPPTPIVDADTMSAWL